MTVSRLFRSCSMKSMTMYTLLMSEYLMVPHNLDKNSLSQSLSDDHFPDVHNVFVSASHESIYLSQSGDGKPVLFFFEFQLLERDDIPGLRIASAEDDPVRALLDLVQPFVGEHRAGWENGRVERPRWNTYAV